MNDDDNDRDETGVSLSVLREVGILGSLDHPSTVRIKKIVAGDNHILFLVMDYMEHDLKQMMKTMKLSFSLGEVKCLMRQLLEGVKYLHDNWILHRDTKTANILLNGHLSFYSEQRSTQLLLICGTPNEEVWSGFAQLTGSKKVFPQHTSNRLRGKFPSTSFKLLTMILKSV